MPELLKDRAASIVKLAQDRHMTLATVESCTAGSLANLLSQAEGASSALHGGFIVYTKENKIAAVGVPDELLAAHTAVSRPLWRRATAAQRSCHVPAHISCRGPDVHSRRASAASPRPKGRRCRALQVGADHQAAIAPPSSGRGLERSLLVTADVRYHKPQHRLTPRRGDVQSRGTGGTSPCRAASPPTLAPGSTTPMPRRRQFKRLRNCAIAVRSIGAAICSGAVGIRQVSGRTW